MKKLIAVLLTATLLPAQMVNTGNHRKIFPSGGATPAPVGTPSCQHSASAALGFSYTPSSAGDGIVFTWSVNSTTVTLSTVADNASGGSSTYTIISGLTGQHGAARSLQLAYTTSVKSGVSTITFTPSTTGSAVNVCAQEFSNVTGVANATGVSLSSTGTYSSGTTPACTIANSTDYIYLGGVGSVAATTATGTNGTLTSNMYLSSGIFTWEQYALNAKPTGSINFSTAVIQLACADVQ